MEVQNYKFLNFTESTENESSYQDYKFSQFDKGIKNKQNHDKIIRYERENANKKSFSISPIVLEHRGMNKQSEDEIEKKISEEVHRRVEQIEIGAFKKGYEDGVRRGRDEVYNETRKSAEEKISNLSGMIAELISNQHQLLLKQKNEAYEIIRSLTKWIILRELKDDGKYIERLLEKLIIELQSRTDILLLVGQKNFSKMPEVLEVIQEKLGKLNNVRIEIDHDIDEYGLVVESKNGIVNGSLQEQFNSLDKLFETVIATET